MTLLVVSLLACSDPDTPKHGILIKNEIQDRTYNTIRIDRVMAGESGLGVSGTLRPGQTLLLRRGVTGIRFSREYKEFTRTYLVECPADLTKGIVIKLIDVHMNRIAGGCKTISYKER